MEQVTAPAAIQAALAIGRRAARHLPKDGEEDAALDTLLRRMARWAEHIAPLLTLPEFVVQAQKLGGNRMLRPLLADVRLAELRHVGIGGGNGDVGEGEGDGEKGDGEKGDGEKGEGEKGEGEKGNVAVVAEAGPSEADMQAAMNVPAEAAVAQKDDEWDEPELEFP